MLVDFQLFAIKLGKPLLVQTFAEQLKIIYLPYHSQLTVLFLSLWRKVPLEAPLAVDNKHCDLPTTPNNAENSDNALCQPARVVEMLWHRPWGENMMENLISGC